MAIARDAIPAMALPEEVVAVAALGGDVIVRGMDLPQMLRYKSAARAAAQPQPGEGEHDTAERIGGALVPLALSMCVLADDRLPVYTEGQWAYWCRDHMAAAVELAGVVLRMSGQAGDQEKKD